MCSILPPFLAYRLQNRCFFDLISFNTPYRQKALFGSATISSYMNSYIDVNFALHRTINFIGMIVAQSIVKQGDTIFELGANIGTETFALSNLTGIKGHVIAVEASPRLANTLKSNIKLAEIDNVTVINEAIAEKHGTLNITHGLETNLGASFASDDCTINSISVPAIPVDYLVEKYGNPTFVFMDIEGSEYGFARGGNNLLSNVRPVIFTEIVASYLHRSGGTISEFCRILQDHSYSAFDANSRQLSQIDFNKVDNDTCSDWLLIPSEKTNLVPNIRKLLLMARTMPRIGKLNPLDFLPKTS